MANLRVLVDAGVGKTVEEWFRDHGHDMKAVRDRDPRMPDADILAWAVMEKRLVVTMDKDFGKLVFKSGQAHGGVLLLRLEGATSQEKVDVVEKIVTRHADRLPGAMAVFQNGRLRVRP